MKLFKNLLFLIIILTYSINAQENGNENFIKVISPSSDTVVTYNATQRLLASTNPESKISINGIEMKVYESGAFVTLLKLQDGENLFTIKSIDKNNSIIEKQFLVIKKMRDIKTTDKNILIIEDIFLKPSEDMWLDVGDILEVQFKGTPGCNATFEDGIQMFEVDTAETQGIGGIYRGSYRIKPEDSRDSIPIKFTLENNLSELITKETTAKISFIPTKLPRVGLVKTNQAYFNYGLGDDRLGGAIMEFIEEGIKLKIVGKIGEQFKVRLSDNHIAWIPVEQVDLLPVGSPMPYSLVGSWSVNGDDKYDYVNIRLEEKLPYVSYQEINPTKIVVDIYGAVSNTNWITQHLTTKEIKNVYYQQIENEVYRIIIELKHKQIWGYSINYEGTNLIIKVKHQPDDLELENLTIALDAGHGGDNIGAVSSTGLLEKDVNLQLNKILKEMLEDKGAKVILTRDDDYFISISERLEKIKDQNIDILISIHNNAIGSTSYPEKIKGTSTYYKHICYRSLSLFIYEKLLEIGLSPFGNIGSFNFGLNSPTEYPNVLVELAFMSNPEDEILLMNEKFLEKACEKIVEGLDEFLRNCE